MKNIKIYQSILAGCLMMICFTACDLNEFPVATTSRAAVFGSKSGLEMYVASFYGSLPTPSDGEFLIDDDSDIIARIGVDNRLSPNALSPVTSSGWTWVTLRNINYFIDNCEKSSVAEKEHYLGVAHFFRAYFYFAMVKRFGDVPWIDRPIEVDDEATLYGPRTDRFEVMEHVLADLNYAIEHITLTNDPSCTLITQNVARAYKTRVCLYEASFRKYHVNYGKQATANTWYQEVVSTANAMTGFSLHQGATAYRDLFLQTKPYTDETILCVALSEQLLIFSSRNSRTLSATTGNRPSLTRKFVNTYLKLDGTPFTNNPDYLTTPFTEEVKNRDLRLKGTIRLGDYKRTSNGVPVLTPPNMEQFAMTGYQVLKGCYDEIYPYDFQSRNLNAHIILRWAEVLLNKAEALAELGTMTNADWIETIGAIRSRAGITGNSLNAKPTVADPYMQAFYHNKFTDPVLLEVLRDRAIEMVMDGLRPDDLIRWRLGELFLDAKNGMYVPALGDYDLNGDGIIDVCFYQGTKPTSTASSFVNVSPSTGVGRVLSENTSGEIIYNPGAREWLDKKYLYPIPETDKIKNPALGQNPGWE
jgi:hypothetical protein